VDIINNESTDEASSDKIEKILQVIIELKDITSFSKWDAEIYTLHFA